MSSDNIYSAMKPYAQQPMMPQQPTSNSPPSYGTTVNSGQVNYYPQTDAALYQNAQSSAPPPNYYGHFVPQQPQQPNPSAPPSYDVHTSHPVPLYPILYPSNQKDTGVTDYASLDELKPTTQQFQQQQQQVQPPPLPPKTQQPLQQPQQPQPQQQQQQQQGVKMAQQQPTVVVASPKGTVYGQQNTTYVVQNPIGFGVNQALQFLANPTTYHPPNQVIFTSGSTTTYTSPNMQSTTVQYVQQKPFVAPKTYTKKTYVYPSAYNRQQAFAFPEGVDPVTIGKIVQASTIFRYFDPKATGYITKKEFKQVIHRLGWTNIHKDDRKRLFKAIDTDGTGKISEREFIEFWISL